jgi:FSR family fosmidomycin resistance protein-like MFS transporter
MTASTSAQTTVIPILAALSFSHMLNDMIQSLLPAIYPLLHQNYNLSFTQIGIITLTYQLTASLLQPMVGLITDRRPQPYSLPFGMACTLLGLLVLAYATSFTTILIGAAMVGTGSSVFHPESSRMARMAAGGKHGFAQSFFQIGGNAGTAIGPLLAAFIIVPHGQESIAWFSLAALLAILVLSRIGSWYKKNHLVAARKTAKTPPPLPFAKPVVMRSLAILMLLVFSKYVYMTSVTSYYIFYLIDKFALDAQSAQLHLFLFLGAIAVGTFAGGPIGDKIGRKYVIWFSILGVLPFTLMLPYADLFWTEILSVIIGIIMASAFSAIVVYAQELVPGRTGMVSGLFFGFAFGVAGIGAAVLGVVADHYGIGTVYHVVSYMPVLGIFTIFLPNLRSTAKGA